MKAIKSKLFLPVIAIVFAVASAFTTTNAAEASTLVDGYIYAPIPCQQRVTCDLKGSIICTNVMGQQAFAKFHPSDTSCPQLVYKPQ